MGRAVCLRVHDTPKDAPDAAPPAQARAAEQQHQQLLRGLQDAQRTQRAYGAGSEAARAQRLADVQAQLKQVQRQHELWSNYLLVAVSVVLMRVL